MPKPTVQLTINERHVFVSVPYNTVWNQEARAFRAPFLKETNSWRFQIKHLDQVRKLCLYRFGENDLETDQVGLRVAFPEGGLERRDAIRLGGRELVVATAHDSGARLGRGVVFAPDSVQGVGTGLGILSSGSKKAWRTEVTSGVVLLVYGAGKALIDRDAKRSVSSMTVSVLPTGPQPVRSRASAPSSGTRRQVSFSRSPVVSDLFIEDSPAAAPTSPDEAPPAQISAHPEIASQATAVESSSPEIAAAILRERLSCLAAARVPLEVDLAVASKRLERLDAEISALRDMIEARAPSSAA